MTRSTTSIVLRPYRDEADHPTIAELDHLMGLGILNYCNPSRDMVFAEVGGQTIGYGRVWFNERDDEHRYFLEISVRDFNASDLEQRLFDWLQMRIGVMRQIHSRQAICSTKLFVPDSRQSLIELVTTAGFEIERTDLTMTRTLSDSISNCILPLDIELRPVVRQLGNQLAEGMAEAFGHHTSPGTPMDAETFEQWMSGMPAIAADSYVAWSIETANVVGATLNHTDHESRRAWLAQIFTRTAWQHRGLVSALITHSLRAFRAQGLHEACIEVNDFNTKAIRVYEKLGFFVSSRVYMYSKACE